MSRILSDQVALANDGNDRRPRPKFQPHTLYGLAARLLWARNAIHGERNDPAVRSSYLTIGALIGLASAVGLFVVSKS